MKLVPTRGLAALSLLALLCACGSDGKPETRDLPGERLEVPARSGSVSPNLAAGPGDTLVLSWLEPRGEQHALRYAVLGADGWEKRQAVASGDNWFVNWADFPSVTPLTRDLWAAHWLVRQPAGGYAYDVVVSISKDGGGTWSEGIRPHDDGTPTEHGFVTLFPADGGAGLVWLDGRNMAPGAAPGSNATGMTLRAATITPELEVEDAAELDELTCDCCQTDVALTSHGAVAVYRDRTAEEIRDIHAARLTKDGWEPGRRLAVDGWNIAGCPVNGPVIAADADALAAAWFTGADDAPRVRVARSPDAGETWSAPVDVAAGEITGHAGLAALPGGRLAVSWVCRLPGTGTGVCLRTLSASDEPGPVHVLSGMEHVPALSVPQLARRGDLLVAAWTEESGTATRIASIAIPIATLP